MTRRRPAPSFEPGEMVRFSVRESQPEVVATVKRVYTLNGALRLQTIDRHGVDRSVSARRCSKAEGPFLSHASPAFRQHAALSAAALSLPA